jgi:cytochrome d ubiquinol oxidase subunit I
MQEIFNPVTLSRMQFAVTTLFHMLWPLLSIGLGLFLVLMEALWLGTGREIYYRHTRFWAKLYLLSFGIGVASGVPLEFQFGTNWAGFSRTSGEYFGNILGFEAAMAFMLEAAFLGIMLFAWERVSRGVHFFATVMVALGGSISAFWIMGANAWMQVPTGVKMENGVLKVTDYTAAILNPALVYSFTHMWVACIVTTLFFVAGISAWAILKNRNSQFFLRSFKICLAIAIIFTPLQIYLGDLSGRKVAKLQPAKTAAMEAHWQTNAGNSGADWILAAWPDSRLQKNAWQIRIPNLLSILITHSPTGKVRGLSDFPPADQPPVAVTFYSFRLMIAIGLVFLFLMLWGLWKWRKGWLEIENITRHRYFWLTWTLSIPLGFIASDLGWVVREVGRQPWVLYNIMRTSEGVSNLTVSATAASLIAYCLVYLAMLIFYIIFAGRIISKGPDMLSPLPHTIGAGGK